MGFFLIQCERVLILGVVHPLLLSAEFVKMCKEQILQNIKAEPLKATTKIYEERFSSMRADLEALNDPQEPDIAEAFVRYMPTVIQFERTMYRARRDALRSNPETQSSMYRY